jgi:hypothetical protein
VKRTLKRILGPKRKEVDGGWRRLYNEELHNLYASPDIIRMIKLSRMRLVVHVARIQGREMHTIFWLEDAKEEKIRKT